ncbi:SRPBCC domain-containing protein [bacterium]|nr:SRPBCC domain-containing protein [bacterium]MDB4088596.1 SRPBCC domain-containing protein [Flavobacteriales bacterium]
MPLTLTTQININASAEEIWSELIDFKSYPEWNPFINKIEGIPLKGNQLKATIGNMKFKPNVLESIPNKKLVWLGKLFIKGVFDGEHSFEIIKQSTNCLFIQKENFRGLLVPFFKKNY